MYVARLPEHQVYAYYCYRVQAQVHNQRHKYEDTINTSEACAMDVKWSSAVQGCHSTGVFQAWTSR